MEDYSPSGMQTLRAALNANATFTHLMIHVGAFEGRSTGRPKIAADAFEIVMGSYYMERGFDALCTWVADMLKPLIAVAAQAFIDLYYLIHIVIGVTLIPFGQF
jgi:dsRNA-specific ribonuclease